MSPLANLKIGLCWGTLERAGLIELIEAAARNGFPTVTARPGMYRAAREAGFGDAAIRKRMADAGTRVSVIDAISAGLPGMPDTPLVFNGRPEPLPDAAMALSVADALEAPVVNVSMYRGEPARREHIADAIGTVCHEASHRGLTIVLEFVPGSGLPTLPEALAVTVASGAPNCGLLLDTWHLARSGGTVADIQSLPAGIVHALQISDRDPPAPGAPYVPMSGRLLPGEGRIPLVDMIEAVMANQPAVIADLEIFNDELREMGVPNAARHVSAALSAWRRGAKGMAT